MRRNSRRPISKSMFIYSLLALLAASIIATLLTRPAPRSYTTVRLAETEHEEVSFRNERQNIDLAGLLFKPQEDGLRPGVVIVHGSGTSIRDNGWYLTMVQYLQQNGIVVLLPDKRGSVKSGGNWRTSSFHDLATDTIAGVEWLASQKSVDPERIGVVGLSEGGHIAPLVANQMSGLAFVVSIVSSTIPMHELLVYEENYNLREFGIPPGLSNVFAYLGAWSLIYLRQKEHWDAIGNFDTAPYWKQISIDALALYGENDTNVPSARSADVLQAMNKPNIKVKIYPDSGHALESPIGEGTSIFREDALSDIVDFIHDATHYYHLNDQGVSYQ